MCLGHLAVTPIFEDPDDFCKFASLAFNGKDDTITGTMRYHQSDDLPFV